MNKKKSTSPSSHVFPVAGIGASAGGLEAFKKLLMAIPEDSGIAYVLVQHLDPSHESLLPELLEKVASIPVLEITDDIKVEPDHIYIIPSNKMLLAVDGVLKLSPRPQKGRQQRNRPIDLFFNSLAEVHQGHAIGMVLSGTGSDGTMGLKSIKDHGGITFAQDEASAAFPEMPHSGVAAGVVDFILPPEEMPGKLLEITNSIFRPGQASQDAALQEESIFKQILSLIRLRKKTDFTYYKQTTIRRRILRRMALTRNNKAAAYLEYLRKDKAEQDALYHDLLIPVTAFFRDPKVFENLCQSVFPEIIKNKAPGEPIRIWVAGCSTGEEAYSIAMCLKESGGNKLDNVQIFATDISETAIIKARSGIYTKTEVEGASHRLQEFFTKKNGHYQVNKQIRDLCVFAVHNFLKDPPFGKIDFISCRNVLIYMEPYLQQKALTTFHYALNPKGYLLLGKSETVGTLSDLLAPVSKHDKLYTRKDKPGKFMQVAGIGAEKELRDVYATLKNVPLLTDFKKTADDIILNKYAPPAVVINEAMDIVQFRGITSPYLEQAPGKPSHHILKMAKGGLQFELRNILHKAKKENTAVAKENIPFSINNDIHLVTIEVTPLPNIVERYYLVLFHDHGPAVKPTGKKKLSKSKKDDRDYRIEQLEKELAQTKEDHRSIAEDQEAINEELQSTNEELLSSSEELQSLNEELETSKEELQSTNEELTVVNQEMASLNEQITAARNFAESIVATIREPLLVLDKQLRVKTANTSFYKTFQAHEQETEGVLIYDLGNKQWNIPALRKQLEEILPQKTKFTDFEVRHSFPLIGERIMLLNAREIISEKVNENLILLAIEDITEQKKHQLKETELLNRFQNLVIQAPVAICVLQGEDYILEVANDYYLQLVERGKNIIGKPLFQSLPELLSQGIKELLDNVRQTEAPFYANEREIHILRNHKRKQGFFNFVYQPVRDSDGTVNKIMVVVNEVTEQVILRKKMEAQATMVQNLLMNAPGFISTLKGPDHVYDLVNERYQQLFGKRKIQGKPVLVALPELAGQGFDKILDDVYKTGKPYLGIDVPIKLARDENLDPELRYFNFSYQPMYDENRNIYSILVFGYEVTEQVMAKNKNLADEQSHARDLEEKVKQRTAELSKANELLRQKNEVFEKMNKELEAFTYVSSHDLQEPLRKIQTFANLIVEKEYNNLSDKGKNHFTRIQDAASRMQTLIEDLLAYSRTNITDRKFEDVHLGEIVNEVKNELAESIQKKGAIIEAGKLCVAEINPFLFRQMLNNLLSNAIKFSKPGIPPHIIINSEIPETGIFKNENLSSSKKYCHISVTDNGIGFDPLYKDQIFEVFQRLHTNEEYPGTGIGLAIVKKIVDNHNGVITATGMPGKGARFDIFIPVSRQD